MKEDGVNLYYKGESYEGNKLFTDDGDTVTDDDKTMVQQQLVRAALPVVPEHVQCVINKISDGKTNQSVA